MTNVPTWLAAVAVVAPAITGLLGYWLAGRNEAARDRRAFEREEAARRRTRAEALADERHQFQLNLLLELQDALRVQARITHEIILHDQRTLKERGGLFEVGPDLNQRAYDSDVNFSRLRVRVLDDDLRNQLDDLHTLTARVTSSGDGLGGLSVAEIKERLEIGAREVTLRFVQVNDLLGVLLRRELGRSDAVL